jgi:hypothetical protein
MFWQAANNKMARTAANAPRQGCLLWLIANVMLSSPCLPQVMNLRLPQAAQGRPCI